MFPDFDEGAIRELTRLDFGLDRRASSIRALSRSIEASAAA